MTRLEKVPAIPQSEILAKFFEEIGEKCGEILAKFFADFRPSISRENGRKKFHEKSSTFSTVHQIKFFRCFNSGGLGAQQIRKKRYRGVVQHPKSKHEAAIELGGLATNLFRWSALWPRGCIQVPSTPKFLQYTKKSCD